MFAEASDALIQAHLHIQLHVSIFVKVIRILFRSANVRLPICQIQLNNCVNILYSDKTDRSSAKQTEPGVICLSDCG